MENRMVTAVILAGGLGTRLSEETISKPKPMVEIGGKPILWHIMKTYAVHGITDFIICLGYRGYLIKEYFANYYLHNSDTTFDLSNGSSKVHNSNTENWKVTLVDTGETTMTAGRIKRIHDYIKKDDFFCLTYGDGLADIDITASIDFHKKHGKLATVSAVKPSGRFGILDIDSADQVIKFTEKPAGDGNYVNGGFFVLSPKVIDYMAGDQDAVMWEQDPLFNLASDSQLSAFKHHGFWQPMDTLRDKQYLESLWHTKTAPWKLW